MEVIIKKDDFFQYIKIFSIIQFFLAPSGNFGEGTLTINDPEKLR
jgi:hypothetical protein